MLFSSPIRARLSKQSQRSCSAYAQQDPKHTLYRAGTLLRVVFLDGDQELVHLLDVFFDRIS